jgi:hypothetical protein
LLHEAALMSMSLGNLGDAVRFASRLVSLSPCVDAYQVLLIRAYSLSGDVDAARQQLQSAVRPFRREPGCDPQPSVFLAAEVVVTKSTGAASPAKVHALIEVGQAQVSAGAADAAIRLMQAACDEAQRTGLRALAATAQLALGASAIHGPKTGMTRR